MFVPCRVIGPGLHPKILITLDESLVTTGIIAAILAAPRKSIRYFRLLRHTSLFILAKLQKLIEVGMSQLEAKV